jgi:MFS family permease
MEPEGLPAAPVGPAPAPSAVLGERRWQLSAQVRSLVRPLRVRDYRLLWSAQVASELGDWATRLALMLLVYKDTRSAALSATVVTVSLLPWVGFGQVLTTVVDHFPRRTVMIGADLLRAVVFGILVIPLPVGALFVGAFLAGLGTAPFESARHAVRIEVTDDSALYGGALTLFTMTGQLTTMVGFAVGGALVALVGARAAFGLNAASFVASACFVAAMRTRSVGRTERSHRQAHLAAAIRFLLRDPIVRWCSTLSMTTAFAGMGIEAIAAVYGRGHPAEVTLLAIAVPVGSVAAAALAPHAGRDRRLLRAAGLLPVLGGAAGLVVFGVSQGSLVGALGFAASGVAIAVPVPAGPVVALRLRPEVRAPAFSVLQGATIGCMAAGAAIGGVLAGIFGAVPTCAAGSAALLLVGAAASARLPDAVRPAHGRRRPAGTLSEA